MKPDLINNLDLLMGVDTLSVSSKSNKHFDKDKYPYIYNTVSRSANGDIYNYRINPDKYDKSRAKSDLGIYDFAEYSETMKQIFEETVLDEPRKTRIDLRFDSFSEQSYEKMLKLNKFFVLLVAHSEKLKNKYQSKDPIELWDLTVCVGNHAIELENYNKAIQEPTGAVTNRLEARSKRLPDAPEELKEQTAYLEWKAIFRRATTRNNLDGFLQRVNDSLIRIFPTYRFEQMTKINHNGEIVKEKSFEYILNQFILTYRNTLYTQKQIIALISALKRGEAAETGERYGDFMQYAKAKYKYLKDNYPFDLYTLQNVKDYYKKLCLTADLFFGKSVIFDTIPKRPTATNNSKQKGKVEITQSNMLQMRIQ